MYYRDVWAEGRKDRKSLKTRDRKTAIESGKQLLAALLSPTTVTPKGPPKLGALWDRYRTESAAWRDNHPRGQRDDERSATLLIAWFGADKDVSMLTADDQVGYLTARKNGRITLSDGITTEPVKARTVQADLKLLHTILKWGMTAKAKGGIPLLASHPLQGIKIPREQNALRPIATYERFEATMDTIASQVTLASSDPVRRHWQKLEMALLISEATGRRIGAISQLQWQDVDLLRREIRWRAAADKKGKEAVVAIPDSLVDPLRQFRKETGAIAGWVFPSSKDPNRSMDRYQFDYWLRRAESLAEVPKLTGGLWHPYRRKWATERKNLPMKDVMQVGGWSDSGTFLTSYQQADRATQLRVVNEPTKLRETGIEPRGERSNG